MVTNLLPRQGRQHRIHKMNTVTTQRTLYYFNEFNKNFLSSLLLNGFCNLQHSMENNPVEKTITEKLKTRLNPVYLRIINESYMHNVPKGSETHFKVVVVSKEFENMSLLNCHRLINSLLEHELKNGVHALSIEAKAPSQWNPEEQIKPSPKCLGGFGK